MLFITQAFKNTHGNTLEKNCFTVPTKASFWTRWSDTATKGVVTYTHKNTHIHTLFLSYLTGLWRENLPGFPQIFARLKALHINKNETK